MPVVLQSLLYFRRLHCITKAAVTFALTVVKVSPSAASRKGPRTLGGQRVCFMDVCLLFHFTEERVNIWKLFHSLRHLPLRKPHLGFTGKTARPLPVCSPRRAVQKATRFPHEIHPSATKKNYAVSRLVQDANGFGSGFIFVNCTNLSLYMVMMKVFLLCFFPSKKNVT